jgi:hypothetical protein
MIPRASGSSILVYTSATELKPGAASSLETCAMGREMDCPWNTFAAKSTQREMHGAGVHR